MGCNWRSCYTGQCAGKEGAVIYLDTVLGSFKTFQDSLILFSFQITRTLWIWTSTDLGQFFSGTGNVQNTGKKKKKRVVWENCFVSYSEICHLNMTKVFTPSQWIPLQKDNITQKLNIYKLQP